MRLELSSGLTLDTEDLPSDAEIGVTSEVMEAVSKLGALFEEPGVEESQLQDVVRVAFFVARSREGPWLHDTRQQ